MDKPLYIKAEDQEEWEAYKNTTTYCLSLIFHDLTWKEKEVIEKLLQLEELNRKLVSKNIIERGIFDRLEDKEFQKQKIEEEKSRQNYQI